MKRHLPVDAVGASVAESLAGSQRVTDCMASASAAVEENSACEAPRGYDEAGAGASASSYLTPSSMLSLIGCVITSRVRSGAKSALRQVRLLQGVGVDLEVGEDVDRTVVLRIGFQVR
jgi:hypothetical protein